MVNYVKFMRGTPTAYQACDKKSDTLYFISEQDSNEGVLYLGAKRIGGDGSSVDFSNFSLANLTDVALENELTNRSLLVYNSKENRWENQKIEDLLFSKASSGFVPQPPAQGSGDLFLKSDGTWSVITDQNTLNQIEALREVVTSNTAAIGSNASQITANAAAISALSGTIDSKIATAVASLLSLQIIGSVEEINVDAINAEKYIYLVQKDDSLNENLYDEYVVINKQIEKIGDTSINLSGYATKEDVTNAVKDLVTTSVLQATTTTLNQKLDLLTAADIEFNSALTSINNLISGLQSKDTEFATNFSNLNTQIQALLQTDTNLADRLTAVEQSVIWGELT